MNLLIDLLPTSVQIDGRKYKINTDYRACLRSILAFEDSELAGFEKVLVMLANLYPKTPENIEEAVQKALWFLNGGRKENPSSGSRVYSFSQDANFIFAAFRQTHGIDLEKANLHWWKFLALFMDIGQNTAFCNLIGMRQRYQSGKMSKDERRAYLDMGDVVNLPELETRTLEEMEADKIFQEAVEASKRK